MACRNTTEVFSRNPRPRYQRIAVNGGIRTSLLTVLALATLAGVAIVVLARSLGPPEPSGLPAGPPSPEASRQDPPPGPEIAGTIRVAPDLTARVQEGFVLFVIARKAAGPPFAVRRIVAPRFPLPYRLGPEDVMMAGSAFEGEVRMSARISRTGSSAAQTGDLEGDHPTPVRVGARDVDIVISRVR